MEPERLKETTDELSQSVRSVRGEIRQKIADHAPDSELLNSENGFQRHREDVNRLQKRTEEMLEQFSEHRQKVSDAIGDTDRHIRETMQKMDAVTDPAKRKALEGELRRLFRQRTELSDLQRTTDKAIRDLQEGSEKIGEIARDIVRQELENAHTVNRDFGKGLRVAAAPLKAGLSAAKSVLRETNSKVNPFAKGINKQDTADHGVESLRMANTAVKKTTSAARTTVSTAKAAVKAPKQIYKTAEGTVKTAVRVTKATVSVSATVITHTIAFLFNPVVLVILLVILFLIMSAALITQAVGADQAEETQVMGGAYTELIGIDDIAARYPDAAEYYRIACEENKAAYDAMIDGLYYSYSDLEHSDLVYMVQNNNGAQTTYERGYATATYKASLKGAWTVPVTERQAIAIAYVYLEMQENSANGTLMDIYEVSFSQDVFRSIVNGAVVWSKASYANQECPTANCSSEEVPNPAYQPTVDDYRRAVERYDDWCGNVVPAANSYRNLLNTYNATPAAGQPSILPSLNAAWDRLNEAVGNWYFVFGNRGWTINADIGDNAKAWLWGEVEYAEQIMNSTPQTITNPSALCKHHHTLYSIGLYEYPSDTVMNTLGFTTEYKEWESLTEYGLNTNPDI